MTRRSPAALALAVLFLASLAARPAAAIPGVTDRVLAGTLLVPFFETGIDVVAEPQDTLLTVHNNSPNSRQVHLQVWNRAGGPTGLKYTFPIAGKATLSLAMRNLIVPASAGLRAQVTDGAHYRGFVTIDQVAGLVGNLTPLDATYPFLPGNDLEGYIYYTHQQGGSVGGLTMVPIEATQSGTSTQLAGFYRNSDNREEIDKEARSCAAELVVIPGSDTCSPSAGATATFRARYFKIPALSGVTRVIVFAWNPSRAGQGGPSAICNANPGLGCASQYIHKQYGESGQLENIFSYTTLSQAVTIITLPGTSAGTYEIQNVPNVDGRTQIYIFSINTGRPASGPPTSAFFEGYIQ